MGFNSENARRAEAIVFDCETYAIDGAAGYLEPATAPDNYKAPEAIAKYIEQANRTALAKAALDIDLARIVALGVMSDSDEQPTVQTARDEQDEAEMLAWFWTLTAPHERHGYRPTLVGFNCIAYDLPLMLRRSLYLGVKAPRLPINKYRHDGIEDLMLSLSFDGALRLRGLSFYAKRFGLDVPADETSGADIAAMVMADDWPGIIAHCRADVLKTAALARRVGVLKAAEPVGIL